MIDIENKRVIYSYETEAFPFQDIFSSLFDIDSHQLEDLHDHLPKELLPSSVVSVNNDQNQEIYKVLYSIDPAYNLKKKTSNGVFLDLYEKFVHHISKNIFKENVIYQKKPTLRVNFPGNKAVGDWHRDRDYNHAPEEINIWVPVTRAIETNTIWTESSFDLEDYTPVNQKFGELLIFDSGLKHGNVLNEENKTRVSFDFRVIPESVYKENQSKSYSQNISFKLGEYFSKTSNEF